MGDSPSYNITAIYGTIELKSWLEAEPQADGSVVMVGHGCCIDRDLNGSIRDVRFATTGCKLTVPAPEPERIFTRLRRWLRANTRNQPDKPR